MIASKHRGLLIAPLLASALSFGGCGQEYHVATTPAGGGSGGSAASDVSLDDAPDGAAERGVSPDIDPTDPEEHVRWFFRAMANGNAEDACSWLSPDGQLKLNQIANDLASTGTVPCAQGLDAIYQAVPSFRDDAADVQIRFDGGGTKETPTYLATFGPYVWEVELLLNVDHFTIMAIWDKSDEGE